MPRKKKGPPPGPPAKCGVVACQTMIPWAYDGGSWHRPFVCDPCTAAFLSGAQRFVRDAVAKLRR